MYYFTIKISQIIADREVIDRKKYDDIEQSLLDNEDNRRRFREEFQYRLESQSLSFSQGMNDLEGNRDEDKYSTYRESYDENKNEVLDEIDNNNNNNDDDERNIDEDLNENNLYNPNYSDELGDTS